LPALPDTSRVAVLATVGVPPATGTAPPFTRMSPAASRLTVTVLSASSPSTVRSASIGLKLAEIAIWVVLSDEPPALRLCALARGPPVAETALPGETRSACREIDDPG